MLSFYGRILGPRVARKHLGWYMDGAGTPRGLRKAILTEADPRRVLRLLSDAIGPDAGAAAA
jgi:tRNA-dihydrouridine synthase B